MSYLNEVAKHLDLPPAKKEQVIRELSSHFSDIRDELVASGMDSTQAEREAACRLGEPGDVARRLSAVHNSADWKSALLTGLPFILALPVLLIQATKMSFTAGMVGVGLFAALMLGVTAWQFICDRRPIWLATWFACGFTGLGWIQSFWLSWTPRQASELDATNTVIVAAMSVLTVLALSRQPKMCKLAMVIGAVCVASFILVKHGAPEIVRAIPVLSYPTLMVVLAIGMFARHRYGSAVQSSLFLMALLSSMWLPGMVQFKHSYIIVSGAPLTLAVVSIAFTRASRFWQKMLLLSAGIMLTSAWQIAYKVCEGSFARHNVALSVSIVLSVLFLTSFVITFIPIVIDAIRRKRLVIAE